MSETSNKVKAFVDAVNTLRGFKNADEVAEFLRSQQCKGIPTVSSECAIARYVKTGIGDPGARVTVHGYSAAYRWREGEATTWNVVELTTPGTAISDFIMNFDEHKYPDLEDTEAEAKLVTT